MATDHRDKTQGQREPTNIVREILCGNYDAKITPEIENRLREAARIRAATAKALVEAIYTVFPPLPASAKASAGRPKKAANYRQQQRKRAGPPLRLYARLHLRAERKSDGD